MVKKMLSRNIPRIVSIAVVLAFIVVILGAYTRLTNAGLGCPDWPGCYGHLVVPQSQGVDTAASEQTIEPVKAWTEMIHRYAAGTLALLIGFLAFRASALRLQKVKAPFYLPIFLVCLVLFQAALGMWTVTLKLLPIVVMGHLLGGILIFSCLCQLRLRVSNIEPVYLPCLHKAILLGTILLFLQIALGGWVSANYAGISCIGFPRCNGQWWISFNFKEVFNLFPRIGPNYQGGILDNEVRAAIQMVHRFGALVNTMYLGLLSFIILKQISNSCIRRLGVALIILLLVQISLGIINVLYLLPLSTAVAHNALAALLFATMLMLLYTVRGGNHYGFK